MFHSRLPHIHPGARTSPCRRDGVTDFPGGPSRGVCAGPEQPSVLPWPPAGPVLAALTQLTAEPLLGPCRDPQNDRVWLGGSPGLRGGGSPTFVLREWKPARPLLSPQNAVGCHSALPRDDAGATCQQAADRRLSVTTYSVWMGHRRAPRARVRTGARDGAREEEPEPCTGSLGVLSRAGREAGGGVWVHAKELCTRD